MCKLFLCPINRAEGAYNYPFAVSLSFFSREGRVSDHHRSQYGREVHLHQTGSVDHVIRMQSHVICIQGHVTNKFSIKDRSNCLDGSDWLLCSVLLGNRCRGGQYPSACGGGGLTAEGRVHLHVRDARDHGHPEGMTSRLHHLYVMLCTKLQLAPMIICLCGFKCC